MERFYRSRMDSPGWTAFTVQVKETDLWIRARKDCSKKGYERVFQYRNYLETYIHHHPRFKESLIPLAVEATAPVIIQSMLQAGITAGVGPMAAVAGAMAECVGLDLLAETEELIIENGGDLFLSCREPVTVGIFAGKSPLSGKVGIRLPADQGPRGLCTSSGTIGHSISFGRADAVTILSPSAALADAVATATGNRVRTARDIQPALDFARQIEGIEGALVIIGEQMGVWGGMELVTL
ncbi:MAG: UPF0280 family protein [Thermodesulfobacteriota bacterium]